MSEARIHPGAEAPGIPRVLEQARTARRALPANRFAGGLWQLLRLGTGARKSTDFAFHFVGLRRCGFGWMVGPCALSHALKKNENSGRCGCMFFTHVTQGSLKNALAFSCADPPRLAVWLVGEIDLLFALLASC
jgi:hypothetical protein